ncbi:hypothetical protein Vadar_026875 [Vaccinium darrowii]|uniref:Uncharacterized protein n=1 Tax=Vaccinium darrowii TaxID=229202 RepID=A0ACB7X4B2_9ERIC|nr:hypothetical protein Vadar_026875 [Vaccinium darrowii]
MSTTSVKQLLTKYVTRDENDYVQDVARLLCLFLCHTVFFPIGTTVKWVHLQRVEELDKMMDYDWTGEIIKELMTSIRKYHREPRKATGCVMALLYWLCEHTTLTKAIHPDHPSGIVKWNLLALVAKVKKTCLKDLKRKQVVTVLEDEPGMDPSEVPVGYVNIQDDKEVDESSEQPPSHNDYASKGDVHRVDEAMAAPFDNNISADVGHPVSTAHGFKSPEECELSGIKLNDEYGSFLEHDGGPSIFDNGWKLRELQEKISNMEEDVKVRNEMHAMEMKKKDDLIASMNETILELLAEND